MCRFFVAHRYTSGRVGESACIWRSWRPSGTRHSRLRPFAMVIAAVISFGAPIGALVVARRRLHVQFRAILVGALVFVVFAGLLEQLAHALAFSAFPGLRSTPVAFVPYAALAAGAFEELGRSCGLMLLLRPEKMDHGLLCAIGYGIGHGVIEAIMVVGP